MARDFDRVRPRDLIAIGNDRWEDDRIYDIDFEEQAGGVSLDPGEELTALEIVSNDTDTTLNIHAVGTTRHPGDISDDGTAENIVQYRLESRPDNPTDSYNALPGTRTTAPYGSIINPVELLPGQAVGPMYSFRVVVRNRSHDFANPQSVDVKNIGVVARAETVRGNSVQDIRNGGNN